MQLEEKLEGLERIVKGNEKKGKENQGFIMRRGEHNPHTVLVVASSG